MKSIYERIKNNIRPILQLLLLVGVFFAPRIFKITELIKTPPKLEASQKICDYIFYFAWKGGDWAIGVFFLIVVLFIIRKWNKTYMFNRGNYYKQYRYGWYRICSKILGLSLIHILLIFLPGLVVCVLHLTGPAVNVFIQVNGTNTVSRPILQILENKIGRAHV